MMVQRFPTQYDGILAAAPAINWDKFIPAEHWPQLVMGLFGEMPYFLTEMRH
jgi:feruloyl esterase